MLWTFPKESDLKTHVLFPQGGVSFASGCSWMMNSPALTLSPLPRVSPSLQNSNPRLEEQGNHSRDQAIFRRRRCEQEGGVSVAWSRLVCTINHKAMYRDIWIWHRKKRGSFVDRQHSLVLNTNVKTWISPLTSRNLYLCITQTGIITLVLHRYYNI